ncbi:MAG: hypothetical protein EOP49_42175, partial [Sphingobacteriales bacterium]
MPDCSLFLKFLQEYPDDLIKAGVAIYNDRNLGSKLLHQNEHGIEYIVRDSAKKIFNVHFYFSATTGDLYKPMCTCIVHYKLKQCKHVVAAAIEALMERFNMQVEEIQNLWDDKYILVNPVKTVTPAALFTEEEQQQRPAEWKAFRANPQHVAEAALNETDASALSIRRLLPNIIGEAVTTDENDHLLIECTFKLTAKRKVETRVRYDRAQTFCYQCTCTENHTLCGHVAATFINAQNNHGPFFFLRHKDMTSEKEALLKPFGLSLDMPEAESFEFSLDQWGKLKMTKPAWFVKADDEASLKLISRTLRGPA